MWNTPKYQLLCPPQTYYLLIIAILLLWLTACAPTETAEDTGVEATITATSPTALVQQEQIAALVTLPSTKIVLTESATVAAPDTATPPPTARPSSTTTRLPTAIAIDPPVKSVQKVMSVTETPIAVTIEKIETISAEIPLTVIPLPATQIMATTQPPSNDPPASIPIPPGMEPLLDKISAEAADRANIERTAVVLRSIEAVTWRDGALGCPEAGYVYTQALINGYLIIIDANGWTMEYHTSDTKFFKFCDPKTTKPEKPLPPGSGGSDS